MCETKIKIVYIKKHEYKDKKKKTHVKVGEEVLDHYIYIYIYIYLSKISIRYVKMVTRLVYKKLNEAPKTTRR